MVDESEVERNNILSWYEHYQGFFKKRPSQNVSLQEDVEDGLFIHFKTLVGIERIYSHCARFMK